MSTFVTSKAGWYLLRLGRMSPTEVCWRIRDEVVKRAWARRQVTREKAAALSGREVCEPRSFTAVLPSDFVQRVPEAARKAVLATADELLRGEWEVLGVARTDLVRPDWFADPVTGRRAEADRYAFRIDHRSEEQTGNVKQVWEVSRLQHLTLLATAWFLSRDDAYAHRVAEQLESWWKENPFLTGVHWTSGIEVGLRLISLTWIRRLLDAWPGIADLFERNALAVEQIRWHQQYLDSFRSRGSSANNHVIAEAVGQLVAGCAFPWFPESDRWRRQAARLLECELLRNTFPSGIGREFASDYQCFVAELGLLGAVEASLAGCPLDTVVWRRLAAMLDSGAALLDARQRPPRQGDGDEGRALLLDAPADNRWPSLLAVGTSLFGRLGWWPEVKPDVASSLIGGLFVPLRAECTARAGAARPARRPWNFADSGTTVLRTTGDRDPEIWCRLDGGPHGYLSIAAHAHADALSIEVRYGGVDVLADPGTYCYHGEPEWRSYFRSTIAHNTLEVGGRSQSTEGGPFFWLRHANATEIDVTDIGDAAEWIAEHDGYLSLRPSAKHRRCVRLDRASRTIDIVDLIDGASYDVRLAFHLGPEVEAEFDGECSVLLRWPDSSTPGGAWLQLPQPLRWTLHRGETNPILGWYSCGLGRRTPSVTLLGCGQSQPGPPFATRLEFFDMGDTAIPANRRPGL